MKKKNLILLGLIIFSYSCTKAILNNNPEPQPSTGASNQPSASPLLPSQNAPTSNPPLASPQTLPTAPPGGDIYYGVIKGQVYDADGILLDGAKVNARSLDPDIPWQSPTIETIKGAYQINNAPYMARVEITASKPGFGTRKRIEAVKVNFDNIYDFGGKENYIYDSLHEISVKVTGLYSLPDEPEISSIKVNGTEAAKPGEVAPTIFAEFSQENLFNITNYVPTQYTQVGLSDIDGSALEIEMNFSEEMDKESVENAFRIQSEATNKANDFSKIREKANDPTGEEKAVTIDNIPDKDKLDDKKVSDNDTSKYLTFSWNTESTGVLIKYNAELLNLKSPPQTRYMISFTNPFKDKTGKKARSATSRINDIGNKLFIIPDNDYGETIASTNGYIRYGSVSADYLTISLKSSF